MGAIVLSEAMTERLEKACEKYEELPTGFTTAAHPVGCAIALAAIGEIVDGGVFNNVQKVAPAFQRHLRAMGDHPMIGEARGVGLMGALEIVADKRTKSAFPGHLDVSERVSAAGLGQWPDLPAARCGRGAGAALHHHRRPDRGALRHSPPDAGSGLFQRAEVRRLRGPGMARYRLSEDDLPFAAEFLAQPFGYKSPGLQRVLNLLRGQGAGGSMCWSPVSPIAPGAWRGCRDGGGNPSRRSRVLNTPTSQRRSGTCSAAAGTTSAVLP